MSTDTQALSPDGPALVSARWLAGARDRDLPPEVVDAARSCLIDWFGCALAGTRDELVHILQRRLRDWSPAGSAPLLTGGTAAPLFAALLHSTCVHSADFDDTHIWTDAHFGGPTWSAILARLRAGEVSDDTLMLQAFVAGFEVGAKIGGRRMGHALLHRGFQATGLLGRLSAAAAGAVMAGLSAERAAVALTAAGCQTGGLSTTVGTMMKPFQGGKTAFDAVLAVDLAGEDFTADPSLFETGGGPGRVQGIGGLARALVQDGFAEFVVPDFAAGWEILRNSIKPFPCLYSLNPVADAAVQLAPRLAGRAVRQVRVFVGPSVPKVARYARPQSSHEGRFSIEYIAVLGLLGRDYREADFEPPVMQSAPVQQLLGVTGHVVAEGRKMFNAAIEVTLASGEVLECDVPFVRGHPANPLKPAELQAKFLRLAEPALGKSAAGLLDILERFPAPGSIAQAVELCRRVLGKGGG